MLDSFLLLAIGISIALSTTKHNLPVLMLADEELSVIRDLLQVLKHFMKITEVMISEKMPTINFIIPYVTNL